MQHEKAGKTTEEELQHEKAGKTTEENLKAREGCEVGRGGYAVR